MNSVFENGEYVVYGKVGVCRVVDRRTMRFGGAESGEYYFLAPQDDPRSLVYVPCDNGELMARLRPLMKKEEIDAMLRSVSDEQVDWIEERNERSTAFRRILAQGDRRQIVRLIRCLNQKKQERIQAGKKLSNTDEVLLQACVRLVDEEFSLALGIPRAQVGSYIQERL